MFNDRRIPRASLRAMSLALVVALVPVTLPASSLPELSPAPRSARFT